MSERSANPQAPRRIVGGLAVNMTKTPRKRVLVADCHGEVLIVLEKILEDAGFDTMTVWTAQEVLNLLDSQLFDVVLVNEYLPDAECEELLKKLQNKGEQLPCIVMQPSTSEITDVSPLRKLGVRDVVCKRAYQQVVDAVGKCLGDRTTKLVV